MFFKAIESLTKELNIVDLDLKQMNKRQKCSSSSSNVNNPTNSNDNPILSSNSTNDIKEDSSSTSNDTTIVNDTVPNWIQSGGQVREKFEIRKFDLFLFEKDLRATPDMKTDKQQVASSSSSILSSTTAAAKNEIAPGGAVVRFAFLFD